MADPRLLVCSNRGPFTFSGDASAPVAKRGGGGLIGSVGPVVAATGATWVAAAMSETDRRVARLHPEGQPQDGFTLRFLDIDERGYHLYYDVMANEVLWFLFHYLFDVPHSPTFDGAFDDAWTAYRTVNEGFAEVAADANADVVLFEDYHLLLAGNALRRRSKRKRPIVYFHHTPWCEPGYLAFLPDAVVDEVMTSMLAYDVVGFHSRRWADAFLRCCDRLVRGAVVHDDEVRCGKRTTRVIVAPVPVDAPRLKQQAKAVDVDAWIESHDAMRAGRKLLLRVDRIDLSKNPLRGFLAFEQLLERRPELVNEVVFLALLYPSRLTVERYQNYYAECLGVVRRVNEKWEKKVDADVGPIHLLFEDDFERSLGAMRIYDVLLVNPVFDGLNLVCKEGPVLNERDGSLILSRNAGAFEEMSGGAIDLNPFDVTATTDALERAIEMPGAERAKRAKKLEKLATASTPADWLATQLAAARA